MGEEEGLWRLVQFTLEDLEADGTSSVHSSGLMSILSIEYAHDVHIDSQHFVSAWVESDHKMKRAYLFGLLYACVILFDVGVALVAANSNLLVRISIIQLGVRIRLRPRIALRNVYDATEGVHQDEETQRVVPLVRGVVELAVAQRIVQHL
jgi:hypothetical protein